MQRTKFKRQVYSVVLASATMVALALWVFSVANLKAYMPPLNPPDAPKNVQGIGGDKEATITWNPPDSNDGSPIKSYLVTIVTAVDQSEEVKSEKVNVDDFKGTIQLSRTIGGLENGKEYKARVKAINKDGDEGLDGESDPFTVGPPELPAVPQDVKVEVGDGEATVSWNALPQNEGSPITRYSVTLPFRIPNVLDVSKTDSSQARLNLKIDNLENGKSYTATVTGHNQYGAGEPSESTPEFKIGLQEAPENVRAEASNGSVTVSWDAPDANSGNPITGYDIERTSEDGSKEVTNINTQDSQGPISDDTISLPNGISYAFAVRVVTDFGTSEYSPPTHPVTVGAPGAPTNVETEPGDGTVVVRWKAPDCPRPPRIPH